MGDLYLRCQALHVGLTHFDYQNERLIMLDRGDHEIKGSRGKTDVKRFTSRIVVRG